MTFMSADQMFEALSAQVSDEDFVMRAVKTAFPDWKRDTRNAEIAARRANIARLRLIEANMRAQAAAQNEWAEISVTAMHKMLADGSRKLLLALHRQHPAIMHHLAKQDVPQVVFP